MEYLDLDKSFVFLNPNKDNCWRVSIKSLLINFTDSKKYYLTKECRAEQIGQYPFAHPAKSELCVVVEEHNCKYQIRNIPILKKNDFNSHYYQIVPLKKTKDDIVLTETNYKFLDYDDTLHILNKRGTENIYCKLDYCFQGKQFSLFSKVEYLNFPGSNQISRKLDNSYLQPIMGYVPFEKDGKIHIAYVVRYISPKLEGNLEFRLRGNTNFSNLLSRPNDLKGKLKYFLVSILNFIKVSEFSHRISIETSEYKFFKKTL